MTSENETSAAELRLAEIAPHRTRSLFFLCLAVGGVGFTMALQMGLNSNFVGQEMMLTGRQQGILEAFRESCGIFALGLLAILAGLAEPLIGAAMLLLLGVGMAMYASVHDFFWLVAASLVWSQGLHVWMPLPNSMALSLAEPGCAGKRLGLVQSVGAIGSGVGLLAALLLHWWTVPIRPLYLLAAGGAILGAFACLGIYRRIKTPGPRLVFRRKYTVSYLLSFLEGWRKQIVIAFAGYLLVVKYKTELETMLWLWIAIQLLGWLISPVIGRLIDRLGERKMLIVYYLSLAACFTSYALVDNKFLLYAVFVIDNAFFAFAMALTTYVNRIAPSSEHTATLSMGVAMNHVAAVTMPLVGGFLWKLGSQWTFATGVAAVILSLAATFLIPPHPKKMPA